MKNKLIKNLIVFVLLLSFTFLVSCSGKKPDKDYIEKDYVTNNIVSNFKNESLYSKYSVTGTFNYFNYSDDLVPHEVNRKNQTLNDLIIGPWECPKCGTLNDYNSSSCSNETPCIGSKPNTKFSCSYYLNLPLHITKDNWIIMNEAGKLDTTNSTNYLLEGRIHAPNSGYPEHVYYYERPEGGFIIKVFGTNKALRIINPSDVVCHAKWNITVEYDENGYLVSETFETLNAQKDPNTESVYGTATYTYEN